MTSVVYFLASDATGHVKIGTTRDLDRRVAELTSASPTPLRLLGAIRGDVREERRWHRRHVAGRVGGEWFVLGPVLLAEIHDAVATQPLPARKASAAPRSITIHKFPADLMAEVEDYMRTICGHTAIPSKHLAFADLVRKGLGVVRGDSASAVRRGE